MEIINKIISENVRDKSVAELCAMIYTVDGIYDAVTTADIEYFKTVNGVGPVTAKKLLKAFSSNSAVNELIEFILNCNLGEAPKTAKFTVEYNPSLGIEPPKTKNSKNWLLPKELVSLAVSVVPAAEDAPVYKFAMKITGGSDPYAMFKSVSNLSSFKEDMKDVAKAFWFKLVEHGIWIKGRKYVPFGHGTNDGKTCTITWCREDIKEELIEFSHNGARPSKNTAAKFCAYGGLTFVNYSKVFEWTSPERWVMSKTLIAKFIKDTVMIEKDGIKKYKDRVNEYDAFDGFLIMHLSNKRIREMRNMLSGEELEKFNSDISKLKDGSIRSAFFKGFVTVIDFHRYYKDRGIKKIDGVNVDDIDIIFDPSVFKAKIGEGCEFKDWSEYCQNWHKFNHKFSFLIEEHKARLADISNQQVRGLNKADRRTLEALGYRNIGIYNAPKYRVEEAIKLHGGIKGKLCEAINEYLNVPVTKKATKDMLTTIFEAGAAAKILKAGYNQFCAPDPFAFMDNAAGLEVHAVVEEGTVVTFDKAIEEGLAIYSRNPSTSIAGLREMYILKSFEGLNKYIVNKRSRTVFCPIKDCMISAVRGDYDGDHLNVSQVDEFVNCVESVHNAIGDFFINWDVPSGTKVVVTEEVLTEYFKHLVNKDALGRWDNALSKMYFNGASVEDIAYGEYCINVLVDASKHGINGVVHLEEYDVKFSDLKDQALPLHIAHSRGINDVDINRYQKNYGDDACSIVAKTFVASVEKPEDYTFNFKLDNNINNIAIKFCKAKSADDLWVKGIAGQLRGLFDAKDYRKEGWLAIENDFREKHGIELIPKNMLDMTIEEYDALCEHMKEAGRAIPSKLTPISIVGRLVEMNRKAYNAAAVDIIEDGNDDDFNLQLARANANERARLISLHTLTKFAEERKVDLDVLYDIVTLKVFTSQVNDDGEEMPNPPRQLWWENTLGYRAIQCAQEKAGIDVEETLIEVDDEELPL